MVILYTVRKRKIFTFKFYKALYKNNKYCLIYYRLKKYDKNYFPT